MANEITANLRLQLANGLLDADFNPGKLQIDQAGSVKFEATPSIATSETTVSLTGITTPGMCILYNLGANFVEAGTTTADYPIKLRASGLPAIFPLNAGKTTLYLKADTAATRVWIIVLEE